MRATPKQILEFKRFVDNMNFKEKSESKGERAGCENGRIKLFV